MARPKKKKDTSFAGYGLKPDEDKRLVQLLEESELSAAKVVRALLREWIKVGGQGVLSYSNTKKNKYMYNEKI